MEIEGTEGEKDWTATPLKFAIGWGLPVTAMLMSTIVDEGLRTAVWSVALTWMGVGCLLNAARCRRRHCFFTGPFFLFFALIALLHGLGIVSIGVNGWVWIGWITIIGGLGLTYFTEKFFGRYASKG